LIVIAKLGNAEMLGQFALGLAITAPVLLLASLALRPIQATDAKSDLLFGDYVGLRLLTNGLALVAVAWIVLAAGYRQETALVILAVGAAKAIEAASDVFFGLLQRHERMDYISKSQLLKGPLSLAAMVLSIYWTGSILWGVISLASCWMIMLFGYDIPNGAKVLRTSGRGGLRPRWHLPALRRLVWLALPLGCTTMFVSISAAIPRYYIERYWGERELGIFAAMAYLMVAGSMVVNAVGQSASPRLAQYYAQRQAAAFWALVLKLMGIAALIAVGGIAMAVWFGPEVLALLYRPEYAQHAEVLVWVMVAAGISYIASCLGYGITATRAFGRLLLPYLGVAALTLAAAAWLIPSRGLIGGAWTLCLTAVASCAAPLFVFSTLDKKPV
jgi:O-antigen/teichoic acid export membrane protein